MNQKDTGDIFLFNKLVNERDKRHNKTILKINNPINVIKQKLKLRKLKNKINYNFDIFNKYCFNNW